MIVIAIIGIIASFALPAFMEARKKANEAAAIAVIREFGAAFQKLGTDNPLNVRTDGSYTHTYQLSLQHLLNDGTLPEVLINDKIRATGGVGGRTNYRGYQFLVGTAYDLPSYEKDQEGVFFASTRPLVAGRTGDRAFLIREDGTIYFRPDFGAADTWTQYFAERCFVKYLAMPLGGGTAPPP